MELSEYLQVNEKAIRSLQRDKETGGYRININGMTNTPVVTAAEITEHSLTWKSYELTPKEPQKNGT